MAHHARRSSNGTRRSSNGASRKNIPHEALRVAAIPARLQVTFMRPPSALPPPDPDAPDPDALGKRHTATQPKYRATFENGGALGFSIVRGAAPGRDDVDGAPVIVGQVARRSGESVFLSTASVASHR